MLSLDHVSVSFNAGTPNEVRALQDISLSVADGEFVTVIGSNGAGKSTLFNVISGAVEPDSGHITLEGRDITYWPEYRRSHDIGRVFQDPRLGTCPGLTIRENLSLAAIHGRSAGFRRDIKKADDAWFFEQLQHQRLGLERRLDADVALLSGGQRQAITLVMATLTKPKLLLLDEHTAALDPNAAEQVIALTQELAQANDLCVVMITHSMQQACDLGDRVIMMNRGRIEFEIAGEERENLTPGDLIDRFHSLQDGTELSDAQLLS
ncbi:MAG: ATP-binding cassette domain-containing protein [Chloroflexota bacterium]|nr:ATP-binding cassette domain-containing protein [Chloroflexota bacterium]MDE2853429.1 ATP-binding cassette domain-containing protein [Chloroflexota bacterium]MDE2947716.1 ATP-binding cassette domain-containing protein [Chloroflexota bacterium]